MVPMARTASSRQRPHAPLLILSGRLPAGSRSGQWLRLAPGSLRHARSSQLTFLELLRLLRHPVPLVRSLCTAAPGLQSSVIAMARSASRSRADSFSLALFNCPQAARMSRPRGVRTGEA